MTCHDVDQRLAAFADDELAPGDRDRVAAHLASCPACAATARAEMTGRAVLRTRARHGVDAAPAGLRARCAAAGSPTGRTRWFGGWIGLAAAAVLMLAIAGAVIRVVAPVPAIAAQTTIDHLKCSRLGPKVAVGDPATCERDWQAAEGWPIAVPSGRAAGLTLTGFRRCLLTEGRMAHLMYRQRGEMVSLFVLRADVVVSPASFEMLGYRSVVWRRGDRVYVLVARGDPASVAATVAALQSELERPAS